VTRFVSLRPTNIRMIFVYVRKCLYVYMYLKKIANVLQIHARYVDSPPLSMTGWFVNVPAWYELHGAMSCNSPTKPQSLERRCRSYPWFSLWNAKARF